MNPQRVCVLSGTSECHRESGSPIIIILVERKQEIQTGLGEERIGDEAGAVKGLKKEGRAGGRSELFLSFS